MEMQRGPWVESNVRGYMLSEPLGLSRLSDIDDAILKLYTYGGIIHPSMSDTLILNFSEEQAKEILNGEDISSEWRRMARSIVDKYPN